MRMRKQSHGISWHGNEVEYHMELDETVKPVQHPPRRVPVAIRERLQEALEDLESREIVARVTTPTPWVSSMVVVSKPNGTLRICLDPKDLNRALQFAYN